VEVVVEVEAVVLGMADVYDAMKENASTVVGTYVEKGKVAVIKLKNKLSKGNNVDEQELENSVKNNKVVPEEPGPEPSVMGPLDSPLPGSNSPRLPPLDPKV
jgi:hypothetical protein